MLRKKFLTALFIFLSISSFACFAVVDNLNDAFANAAKLSYACADSAVITSQKVAAVHEHEVADVSSSKPTIISKNNLNNFLIGFGKNNIPNICNSAKINFIPIKESNCSLKNKYRDIILNLQTLF